MRIPEIIVIGAGPAGIMAAICAAEAGCAVTVYEKNHKTGKKLRITGKGRCNVTNDCSVTEFMEAVPENSKFLYSAVSKFSPSDTKTFFEDSGVPLKTERGRRVFPLSDNAHDVADALERAALDAGIRFRFNSAVEGLVICKADDGSSFVTGIRVAGREIFADAVIVATGGASYPGTGSTGDGYGFAESAGLKVIPPTPSLIPIVTAEKTAHMSGLSLKNVSFTVKDKKGKTVFSEMGEMLFTHFGLSGPLVLSASAHMRGTVTDYTLHIDMKPALDEKTLDTRLVGDLTKYSAKDFGNSLSDLLPRVMIPEVVERSGIDPRKKSGSVTKGERAKLLSVIKDLSFTPKSFRPINEAIITRGGVDTKAIAPGTMAAKKVPGLYFAGEVIDTDAYTGGYNLQIAFSTGRLAGMSAAKWALTRNDG